MGDSFQILTNPSFTLNWDGADYEVKKANLEMVAQYQARAAQYVKEGTGGSNLLLAAYAIWLVLKSTLPALTEQEVLEKVSGDIDLMELFTMLGFMNPARIQAALKASQSTTENSGAQ